jgi:large subunit ribosomal protein L15
MKFHELSTKSNRAPRRVGRGISAGQGKTAGRGTKGQNARTGGRRRPGFEGGQNPLYMRLPKLRGFRSQHTPAEIVYTGHLDHFGSKTITTTLLAEAGLISNPYVRVKLVVKGEVTKKVSVEVQAASEAAKSMVQKAGGSFKAVDQTMRPARKKAASGK